MKLIYSAFIILCVLILSSLVGVKNNIKFIFQDQVGNYDVNIVLNSQITSEEIDKLINKIQSDTDLNDLQTNFKYKVIDPTSQIKEMEYVIPGFNEGLFEAEELKNILSPILTIELSSSSHFKKVSAALKKYSEISEIHSSYEWSQKIRNLLNLINRLFMSLIVVFFVCLCFLNILFIRTYLQSSARTIQLKSLLGATPIQSFLVDYLRISYLTAVCYFVGGGLSFLTVYYISHRLKELPQFLQVVEKVNYFNGEGLIYLTIALIVSLSVSLYASYNYTIDMFYENE